MILILYWNKNRQQVLKKKKDFLGVWYLCVLDFSKTLNLKLLMAPSTLSHYHDMFWEWNWVRESGNEHGLGSMTTHSRFNLGPNPRCLAFSQDYYLGVRVYINIKVWVDTWSKMLAVQPGLSGLTQDWPKLLLKGWAKCWVSRNTYI
jgi:hypothetical protein